MSTMNRFQLRSASHLFLVQGEKILLARRKGAWKAGFYSVPAGHIDGEETAEAAMIREVKEEIGIDISLKHIKFVHVMHRKAKVCEYIDFFSEVTAWKGEIKNLEPGKCDDLSWYAFGALPENTVNYIREAIERYKKASCIQNPAGTATLNKI